MSNISKFINKLAKAVMPVALCFMVAFSLFSVPVLAQVTNLTPGQDILCSDKNPCVTLSDPRSPFDKSETTAIVLVVSGLSVATLTFIYSGILAFLDFAFKTKVIFKVKTLKIAFYMVLIAIVLFIISILATFFYPNVGWAYLLTSGRLLTYISADNFFRLY